MIKKRGAVIMMAPLIFNGRKIMYNRLIVFFIRKKFGLKKYELFRFTNQKSAVNSYYFTESSLIKQDIENDVVRPSNVKLNWFLDPQCQIEKVGMTIGD